MALVFRFWWLICTLVAPTHHQDSARAEWATALREQRPVHGGVSQSNCGTWMKEINANCALLDLLTGWSQLNDVCLLLQHLKSSICQIETKLNNNKSFWKVVESYKTSIEKWCIVMSSAFMIPRTQRRMTAPLTAIATLSDEEPLNDVTAPRPKQHHPSRLKRPARGRIVKSAGSMCGPNDDPKALANLIKGKCGCKADCFSQFRYHDHRLGKWLKERKVMSKMEKIEKDDYVWVLWFFKFVKQNLMVNENRFHFIISHSNNFIFYFQPRSSSCSRTKTKILAEALDISYILVHQYVTKPS